MTEKSYPKLDYPELAGQIKAWAQDLGFADARISQAALPPEAEAHLQAWLEEGCHGEMDYMQAWQFAGKTRRTGSRNALHHQCAPALLAGEALASEDVLANGRLAYLSRYALGRDYHKVIRARLEAGGSNQPDW
jgi:epoxyqueuosine reductase